VVADVTVRKSVCYFCHVGCRVLVHVKDGRVVRVVPDPDAGPSFCEKPAMAEEFHYHADRLNYPFKRGGRRGEGIWKRIPWNKLLTKLRRE
jgi:anaerobic selenocysteine-containing dehydrogenase